MTNKFKTALGISVIVVMALVVSILYKTITTESAVDIYGEENDYKVYTSYTINNSKETLATAPARLAKEFSLFEPIETECLQRVNLTKPYGSNTAVRYTIHTDKSGNSISRVDMTVHNLDMTSYVEDTTGHTYITIEMTRNPDNCKIITKGWLYRDPEIGDEVDNEPAPSNMKQITNPDGSIETHFE